MSFIIQDWAGNVLDAQLRYFVKPDCAIPMEFESFEDGWEWIYTNVKDEEAYQDLYVEEVTA